MRFGKLVVSAVAVVSVVALAAGCGKADDAPQTAASPRAATGADFMTEVQPEWTTLIDVLGEPVSAAGVVVGFVGSDEHLSVAAWDAATGNERWHKDATLAGDLPANATPYVPVVEHDGHSYTGFFAAGSRNDRLTVVDVGSGEAFGPDEEIWPTTPVLNCTDSKGLCFEGFVGGASVSSRWRFDLTTRTLSRATGDDAAPDGSRVEGGDVSATGKQAHGDLKVGLVRDGTWVWQRPYAEVFAPRATDEFEFDWQRSDDDKVLVGVSENVRGDGQAWTLDLHANHWLTALDKGTGRTLWSVQGGEFCDHDYAIVDDVVIACVADAGTADMSWRDETTITFGKSHGVHAHVAGLDVHTGKELWRLPVAASEVVYVEGAGHFASNDGLILAGDDGRAQIIDLAKGAGTPVPEDAVLSCFKNIDRPGSTRWLNPAEPCDAQGRPLQLRRWSVGAVRSVGMETTKGHFVVRENGSFESFDLSGAAK